MNTSLSSGSLNNLIARLFTEDPVDPAPPNIRSRQPVHCVYGGAHLFSSKTFEKIGTLARRAMDLHAPDEKHFAAAFGLNAETANAIYPRIREKLVREPVEDFRVDFEDGFGVRSDEDEDSQAVFAAEETSRIMSGAQMPLYFGIRVKALGAETRNRAVRTLDMFLTSLRTAGAELPSNFVVTLPKVNSVTEVALLAEILDNMEKTLGITGSSINIEVMVETARSLVDPEGRYVLPGIVAAARGRCVAAHFGAYDYTSELGIVSSEQGLRHPACEYARNIMQLSLAGTNVRLSDGATSVMPIGPHRGTELTSLQEDENRSAVHSAWRLQYDNIRHALSCGFYQGWDLHPAQLVARYAAVYAFFLEGIDDASARLRSFIEKGARANLVGTSFDDAATGQGLLNYFRRAVDCGAISEDEALDRSGLTAEELSQGTFAKIIDLRAARNS